MRSPEADMSYEISAIAPNAYVSRFEASADAARMRAEEYFTFGYENVVVRKNGALVSWPELNYLIASELVNPAHGKSPGDIGCSARSPQGIEWQGSGIYWRPTSS